MRRFLLKLIILSLFFFLSSLSLPSKVSAQACSQFFPLGGNSNICSNNACDVAILGKDCEQPSFWCNANPWCKKYTGTECCTQRRYDFCRQTFFNPKFACPASLPYNGFQCCFNPPPTPTPTPIPPTPTPPPIPTPTTGPCPAGGCAPTPTPTPTPTPAPFDCSGFQNGLQFACFITSCPSGWNPSVRNTDPGGTTCSLSQTCCWQTPTPTPTGGPTPTPAPCQVTTSPIACGLSIGGTCTVTASVTSGLGSATVNQMRFGAYDTLVATVNPTSDSTPDPYSTIVTGVAGGTTAVWATADLDDKRTCESTGVTDTDIVVSGPTSTPTPTPTPGPCPDGQIISGRKYECEWGGGGGPSGCGNVSGEQRQSTQTCPIVAGIQKICCSETAPTPTPTPGPSPIPTATPTSPPAPTPVPGQPTYSIVGFTFVDDNPTNSIKDAGENCYSGNVTVSLSGVGSRTYAQDSACINRYSFTNLAAGTYTVSFTTIPQYMSTTPTSVTVTVP